MDADSSKFEFRTVATRELSRVCMCVHCACCAKYFQVSLGSAGKLVRKSSKVVRRVNSLPLTQVKELKFIRVVDVRA